MLPCSKTMYAVILDRFATKEELQEFIALLMPMILHFLSFQFMVNECIMSMAFCHSWRNL